MRRDKQGYFYFVDRIGDTFRWKGENVSASEVSDAICGFPGIKQANVYGVSLPEADGQAGMAVLEADEEPDLEALRAHLYDCLPEYAHPLFLLIQNDVDMTSTFKHRKGRREPPGYDPPAVGIYFNHRELGAFIPFDKDLGEALRNGQLRL
jgi:fatty-acyl-CoA synthase